jgi:PTS system nitrogen regulatory IIA component
MTGAAMEIKDFLSPTDAIVDFPAQDKSGLLEELSSRAASALKLDAGVIAGEILKREALGSTGIGDGVAIPHARIAGLSRPFGILCRVRRAIEFDSIDGKPVDLVFFLLLPGTAQSEQLNTLATAARKLRDKDSLHALRKATSAATLYQAVLSNPLRK